MRLGKWEMESGETTVLTGKILRASLKMLSEVNMNLERTTCLVGVCSRKPAARVLKFGEPPTTYRSLGDISVTQAVTQRETGDPASETSGGGKGGCEGCFYRCQWRKDVLRKLVDSIKCK